MSILSDPVDLSGRCILLTGGTGFLGRSLLDYCSESAAVHGSHFHVRVISRDPGRFLSRFQIYGGLDWLSFERGDLKTSGSSKNVITDVIHGAADTHVPDNHADWIDQIVGGTRHMLDVAVKSGARNFLLVSSGAVYGAQPETMAKLPEDYNGAPFTDALSSVYGQAKRVAEQLCTIYAHEQQLSAKSARCFAFTSPHLPLDGPYALGNFVRDAVDPACSEIRVNGDGRAVRTYLDGRDMAHWLLLAMMKGEAGQAYNIGSDQPVTIRDLALLVQQVAAPEKAVTISSRPGGGHRSRYVPAIDRMVKLGARVEIGLEDAIRRTVQAVKGKP